MKSPPSTTLRPEGAGDAAVTLRAEGGGDARAGVRADAIPLLGCVTLALALRLIDLDRESFWLDEAGRVAIARLPWERIAAGVAALELSPPLYHFVLAGWIRLVGDGDLAVRGLSAVLALPAVALAWALGRTVGGQRIALALAAFVAVSPFAVHYGQEAAMYAVLLPLSLGMILAALGALEGLRESRARWLAAYTAFGTLALYTHYYAAFVLATIAVVAVAHAAWLRAWHGVVAWLGAHALIGLALLPWIPVARAQLRLAASVEEWSLAPGAALGLWGSAILADGLPGSSIVAPVAALLGAGLGTWRLRHQPLTAALLAALVVLPLLLALALSAPTNAFRARGFIATAPALWLLLAVGLVGGWPGRRADALLRVALGVVLVGLTGLGLWHHYHEPKEDWRGAAAHVQARAGRGEPIVFVHFAGALAFERYFQGPQPLVGLPQSFRWEDGYHAPYRVEPGDVQRVLPPVLEGSQRVWLVLSHDAGRGSEHVIRHLDGWSAGKRSEIALYGVRVIAFTR